jgi:hypothetical protein
MIRRAGGATALAVLACALTAIPAAAVTITDFCPRSYFNAQTWPPITTTSQNVQFEWYAAAKVPVVEESVPFTVTVSRPDGAAAHQFGLTANSRSNPNEGYTVYGKDTQLYGPAQTGRWMLHGDDAGCADRYFWILSASRIEQPVPTGYATAGIPIAVGTTARGWNTTGVFGPIAGILIDIDKTPTIAGYPKVHVTRARTDTTGRARATVTIYSNTRFFHNNIVETTSRHDPAELTATVYVHKRITRTVTDSTPAVGQTVRLTGTVLETRRLISPIATAPTIIRMAGVANHGPRLRPAVPIRAAAGACRRSRRPSSRTR